MGLDHNPVRICRWCISMARSRDMTGPPTSFDLYDVIAPWFSQMSLSYVSSPTRPFASLIRLNPPAIIVLTASLASVLPPPPCVQGVKVLTSLVSTSFQDQRAFFPGSRHPRRRTWHHARRVVEVRGGGGGGGGLELQMIPADKPAQWRTASEPAAPPDRRPSERLG